MQTPLQITFRSLDHSPVLDSDIRERAARLEHFHPNIISCQVRVEQLSRQHQKGNVYQVQIYLHVPEHDIAVDRDQDEDPYVAVREAFEAATRKLEDVARVHRHQVKAHSAGRD
jgi:ribosome-associated translation inhibitor RaiA